MRNEVLDDLSSLRYNKRYRIWKPFMEKYDCEKICEVGVRSGVNFEKMIRHKPEVAVAVDIWNDDGVMARNDLAYTQNVLDQQYEDFKNRMRDKPFVQIHRDYSIKVAKKFDDNYFDFIYLDADHSYQGVMDDIQAWYPKVKKGKFLIGDDYRKHKTRTGVRFGVIEAVNRFARNNELSFFVFQRSKWGLIK